MPGQCKSAIDKRQVLFELQDIEVSFSGKVIIDKASISISKSEIITLIGPNGGGKTTIVKILLGLIKPDKGKIYKDKNLVIGYVPQKNKIDKILPITVSRFLSFNKANNENIDEVIRLLNIRHLLDKQVHSVSGGEMQRVLLARSLLRKPNLLVLDEPAQGLDLQGQSELYDLLHLVAQDSKCAIFMVSHDLHFVMAKTNKVICLNHHVCCHGHPRDVSKNPKYVELFGPNSLGLYSHKHDHEHLVDGDVIYKERS